MFGLVVMESAPMEVRGTAHSLATTVSSGNLFVIFFVVHVNCLMPEIEWLLVILKSKFGYESKA